MDRMQVSSLAVIFVRFRYMINWMRWERSLKHLIGQFTFHLIEGSLNGAEIACSQVYQFAKLRVSVFGAGIMAELSQWSYLFSILRPHRRIVGIWLDVLGV